LIGLAWLYTLVACFGLYSHELQSRFASCVSFGGLFMFIGLLCFGAGLADVGVSDRDCRADLSEGKCTAGYYLQLPSRQIEGSDYACRICASNAAMFAMSESCEFGWGGILVVVACILSFIASCIGHCVTPRAQEFVRENMRRVGSSRGRSAR